MLPWAADLAGRIERHTIDSTLLGGNRLGDPHVRPLWVYLPPGYDEGETAAHLNARRMTGARYTKSLNTLTAALHAQAAGWPGAGQVAQWLCGDELTRRRSWRARLMTQDSCRPTSAGPQPAP
jgi:hypothetical protein